MRKLVGILVIVFLVSTTINAQGKKSNTKKRANFNAEQMATLQTKRMTLHFDLDNNQKKAIYNLKLKQAEKRLATTEMFKLNKEKGVQLTNEQRFEIQNNRLDTQIEAKTAIKSILNKEQFEKWENHQKVKMRDGKKRMAKGKGNNQKKGNKQDGKPRNSQINRS
ncbi:MAG: hypothetical protein GQ540_01875 [Lutibacter sp.]|uniref:hypothetical protein n=1 Tax=Lutibacter sp. TaxID=1925666 RepID=UPI0019DC14ED|nr:hypothetical protein [Lutibacter sp.]NOR27256.1 hypothetical protein [Lutibacter sp.]